MNKGEGDTFPPIDNKALLQCMFFGVKVAERVADGARADHLRVDLLVKGDCSDLFVSEVGLNVMSPSNVMSPLNVMSCHRLMEWAVMPVTLSCYWLPKEP